MYCWELYIILTTKLITYITSKLQNNNLKSNKFIYKITQLNVSLISIFFNIYTYKYIILYIFKLSHILISLFMILLLCLEFDWFNYWFIYKINKYKQVFLFLSNQTQIVHYQIDSFTILFDIKTNVTVSKPHFNIYLGLLPKIKMHRDMENMIWFMVGANFCRW